jgi:putative transposase
MDIRQQVLTGFIAERVRNLICGICKEYEILKDHVHLPVSVPPHLSISKLLQSLKGKSSCKLLQENKMLSKQFCGRHLWRKEYFVATSGNVTDGVIIEYIKINTVNHNQKKILRLGMRETLVAFRR